ncbi:50S ribosomal subunit protein L21 [Gammaproteobacteria bacterium]
MYAVVMTGGKQYRVSEGDKLRVETLPAEEGETIAFDKVLLVADGSRLNIGSPYVEGGSVTATVTTHGRGEKIRIVKFRRRKHYQKVTGHRQNYTEIRITNIVVASPA